MKSLVDFISESLDSELGSLFKDLQSKLNRGQWDEVASAIDKIFKAKWGRPVKLDDKFADKMGKNEYMLLGCNTKTKAWVIVHYNSVAKSLLGARYNGRSTTKLSTYWGDLPGKIESLALKLRYADANADESHSLKAGIDHGNYSF